ncbi:MAG: ATP-grasp domain-containing protein [Candidatus Bathycorpusculaceae bacterium]
MKLFIYEHLCGGGYAGQMLQPDVLCEGYAMLRALVSDFKLLGHSVTTFIDSRIRRFNPPLQADEIVPISSQDDLCRLLRRSCLSADAVYIIAPESNGILRKLVENVEELGGTPINCKPEAIKACSNKMNVYEKLKRIGIPVPKTLLVSVQEDDKRIRSLTKELGFPIVFKPMVGAGSCGLSMVKSEEQISMAVRKIKEASAEEFFLIQEYVKGLPASVSLISNGENVSPLTLNAQLVRLASLGYNLSYEGGIVPFHHPHEKEAFKATEATVKSFKGLTGYVGVDIILTSNGPVVIEVNPRLTTSYVGLRKVLSFNPAIATLNSVFMRELPRNVKTLGYTFFFKVRIPPPNVKALKLLYALEDVFSHPFPVSASESCALVVSFSNELKSARLKAYEVKRELIEILYGKNGEQIG